MIFALSFPAKSYHHRRIESIWKTCCWTQKVVYPILKLVIRLCNTKTRWITCFSRFITRFLRWITRLLHWITRFMCHITPCWVELIKSKNELSNAQREYNLSYAKTCYQLFNLKTCYLMQQMLYPLWWRVIQCNTFICIQWMFMYFMSCVLWSTRCSCYIYFLLRILY